MEQTPQEKLKQLLRTRNNGHCLENEDQDWLISRVEQLQNALEFYAGLWGEHQGSPVKAVNKFTQNRLNETRAIAQRALGEMP